MTFKKMSKPLLEKKRRARINNSLEELKSLLENHYTYNMRKKKLEKADILELTVKHIHNLLSSRQETMAPVDPDTPGEYSAGFTDCMGQLGTYLQTTKCPPEKVTLMLLDHIHTLDPHTRGRHLQMEGLPRTTRFPEIIVRDEGDINSRGDQCNYAYPNPGHWGEDGRKTNDAKHQPKDFAGHSCPDEHSFPPPFTCHQAGAPSWRPW